MPEHHANQAGWVADLAPSAVVFEMIPPALGPVAERMRGEGADAMAQALRWQERGWPPFEAYAGIFDAAGDAAILGAEVRGTPPAGRWRSSPETAMPAPIGASPR